MIFFYLYIWNVCIMIAYIYIYIYSHVYTAEGWTQQLANPPIICGLIEGGRYQVDFPTVLPQWRLGSPNQDTSCVRHEQPGDFPLVAYMPSSREIIETGGYPSKVIAGDLCCWPHLSFGKHKKLPKFSPAHIGASKRSVFFGLMEILKNWGGILK